MWLLIRVMSHQLVWEIPLHRTLEVMNMDLAIDQLGVRHRRRMSGKSLSAGPWGFEHRFGHDLGTSIKYRHG